MITRLKTPMLFELPVVFSTAGAAPERHASNEPNTPRVMPLGTDTHVGHHSSRPQFLPERPGRKDGRLRRPIFAEEKDVCADLDIFAVDLDANESSLRLSGADRIPHTVLQADVRESLLSWIKRC